MNKPITVSEFRKNTKVTLDVASLSTVYIMRGTELFELRAVGWDKPSPDALVVSKLTTPITNKDICKEHGIEKELCKFMKHKR